MHSAMAKPFLSYITNLKLLVSETIAGFLIRPNLIVAAPTTVCIRHASLIWIMLPLCTKKERLRDVIVVENIPETLTYCKLVFRSVKSLGTCKYMTQAGLIGICT